MTKEGEVWACDAGLFRVVNGARHFMEADESTIRRLDLEGAADRGRRPRGITREGGSCEGGVGGESEA